MAQKRPRIIPIMPGVSFSSETNKAFAAISNVVRDTTADGVMFMTNYPAKRSGSRYIRTGTLRRSWNFSMKSGGGRIEGSVQSNSNVAPYNRDVQGENQRPLFERIGWHNVKELIALMGDDFPKRVQKALDKAFG